MNPFSGCYFPRKPVLSNIWDGVAGHYNRAFRDTWAGTDFQFNAMITLLTNTPQYKGIAASLSWVDITDDDEGVYSFPKYSKLLAGIATANLTRTYPASLMVYLTGRGFSTDDALEILPPNMQQLESVSGSTLDNSFTPGAPIYRYLTIAGEVNGSVTSGIKYNWRFFDPVLMARVRQMIDAFRVFIDNDPNGHLLKIVSVEESAIGTPTIPYASYPSGGGSQASMEAGMVDITEYWASKFTDRVMLQNLNFERGFIKPQMLLLESRKWGYRAQNSRPIAGLIFNPASDTPGALTYINGNSIIPDGISNKVAVCLGVDNPDYEWGFPANTLNPRTPTEIMAGLAAYNPNIMVWQGSTYFDDTSPAGVPSVITYLNTLTDSKGAGGLNTNLPTNLV